MAIHEKKLFHYLFVLMVITLITVNRNLAQVGTETLEIDDPLIGNTTGGRSGGVLTSEGWKTETAFDYISYDIPTCSAGEIEFEVKGIYASSEVFPNTYYDKDWNLVPGVENVHYTMFCMWDRDPYNEWFGTLQWHNPYKCILHVYGYTPGDQYKWRRMKLRLNVAAFDGGYDDDPHAFEDPPVGPFDYDRNHWYHHKLVWGEGHMRWYMDDVLIRDWDYSTFGAEYAPPYHSLRLGSGFDRARKIGGFQAIRLITYRNFKFYRHEDITPPAVISVEPENDPDGVSVDSDVIVYFDGPMDHASAEAAFSLEPTVVGQLLWVGNALYFKRSELLRPTTPYTLRIGTGAKDKAGNNMASEYIHTFTTGGTIPTVVGKYQQFELPLIATGLGTINRYKNVDVKGVFQGPTERIEIEGFWDGGDLWKVRMAPTEVGIWTYQITSSVSGLNTTGSFECVESNEHGFIRVNPNRPHSFMYDDGTPWLWIGETAWRGNTSLIPYDGRWKQFIDLRVEQGHTAVQSIVISYINGLNFWKNEGGTCFVESSTAKDYDRLNPGYFRWIDKRLDYALSKDIVPVIFLTWAQEYIMFSEYQFDRFVRYLVARYAAKNVIWILSGEYNEIVGEPGRSTAEFSRWGQLVKAKDPYDHLISLHPTGRSTSAEFAGENWYGFVMQQTPYYARDVLRDRKYQIPVVNGEPRYFYPNEDNTESRNGLWEIITSGGYYTTGYYTTYAPDKGGWDMNALPDEQRWAEFLNKFIAQIPITQMDPRPDLISSGNLLTRLGKEYLAYARTSNTFTINFSGYLGTVPARWLNPREGTIGETFEIQLGGPVSLTPPFTGDWALYVGEEFVQDMEPPLAPRNLSAEKITTKSISLYWEQPMLAADGDSADKFIVYRDTVQISITNQTRYLDVNLREDTEYSYYVYSVDEAGNRSMGNISATFKTKLDLESPVLTRVTAVAVDTIVAHFTEYVDSISAINIQNYQILQGISIISARLGSDKKSVSLFTAPHQVHRIYTLIARKIKDRSKDGNVLGPNNAKSYHFGEMFQVSGLAPSNYQLAYLSMGDEYYIDRMFTLYNIPSDFQNLLWIKTRDGDKEIQTENFITFTISRPAWIYVAYDSSIKTLPSWLVSWEKTGEMIITTNKNPLELYAYHFDAGLVNLGGNGGNSVSSMYTVLIKPDPSQNELDQPAAPVSISLISQ